MSRRSYFLLSRLENFSLRLESSVLIFIACHRARWLWALLSAPMTQDPPNKSIPKTHSFSVLQIRTQNHASTPSHSFSVCGEDRWLKHGAAPFPIQNGVGDVL
jgi:hypothetical protein